MSDPKTQGKKPASSATIVVVSKRDGFRRAGREWSGTMEVPAADFTAGELEALRSEPMLVVREAETT